MQKLCGWGNAGHRGVSSRAPISVLIIVCFQTLERPTKRWNRFVIALFFVEAVEVTVICSQMSSAAGASRVLFVRVSGSVLVTTRSGIMTMEHRRKESYNELWQLYASHQGMRVRQGSSKVVEFPSGFSRVDNEVLDLFEALLIRWMGRVWPDVRVSPLRRGAGRLAGCARFRALSLYARSLTEHAHNCSGAWSLDLGVESWKIVFPMLIPAR